MEEKLATGNSRIKRRNKTVNKSKSTAMKVSIPGVWVALDTYRTDFGDPEENGHVTKQVEHPVTQELIDAVFVPKRKNGYFEGEISSTKKIKLDERIDDDTSALRQNQVSQSFESNSLDFSRKQLPQPNPNAYTLEDMMQAAEEPETKEEGICH